MKENNGSFEGIVWYDDGEANPDPDMSFMTIVNGLNYGELDDMFKSALIYFIDEIVEGLEPPKSGCVTFRATNISYDEGQMTFPETGQWDFCPYWEMDIQVLKVESFGDEEYL